MSRDVPFGTSATAPVDRSVGAASSEMDVVWEWEQGYGRLWDFLYSAQRFF